jgi:hypothetical protein
LAAQQQQQQQMCVSSTQYEQNLVCFHKESHLCDAAARSSRVRGHISAKTHASANLHAQCTQPNTTEPNQDDKDTKTPLAPTTNPAPRPC